MAYSRTFSIIKQSADTPDTLAWAYTLPNNFLDAYGSPYSGQNPGDVMKALNQVDKMDYNIISRTVVRSEDGLTETWTFLFETQAEAEANSNSYQFVGGPGEPIILPNGQQKVDGEGNPLFYSINGYIMKKYLDTFGVVITTPVVEFVP